MSNNRRSGRTQRSGAAAVEVALLSPFLALLVLGICELGWYANCAQVVNNAARQGARVAVSTDNSNAEVQAAVLSSLSNSMNVDANAVTVRISRLDSTGAEQYEVTNLSANEEGEAIRVMVTVDYDEIGLSIHMLGLNDGDISSYAVMRRQQ